MPNIQGGGAHFHQPQIQRQGPVQQNLAAQTKAAAPETAKDTVRLQAAPSQTSVSSQIVQRLTSDATRANIHALIQQQPVQVPNEKPQLQMLQKPAMGSALAEMLAQHQPAETAKQNAPQLQNQQAQMAGSMQAASYSKIRKDPEDAVERNSLQSGKRVRKEEQEGEFGSLMDMSDEGGMSGDGTNQDQRSDSQKKKNLLQDKKKLLPNRKGVPQKPGIKAQAGNSPVNSPLKKPQAKPVIKNISPLQSQVKKNPPKPKTDEWDF